MSNWYLEGCIVSREEEEEEGEGGGHYGYKSCLNVAHKLAVIITWHGAVHTKRLPAIVNSR